MNHYVEYYDECMHIFNHFRPYRIALTVAIAVVCVFRVATNSITKVGGLVRVDCVQVSKLLLDSHSSGKNL